MVTRPSTLKSMLITNYLEVVRTLEVEVVHRTVLAEAPIQAEAVAELHLDILPDTLAALHKVAHSHMAAARTVAAVLRSLLARILPDCIHLAQDSVGVVAARSTAVQGSLRVQMGRDWSQEEVDLSIQADLEVDKTVRRIDSRTAEADTMPRQLGRHSARMARDWEGCRSGVRRLYRATHAGLHSRSLVATASLPRGDPGQNSRLEHRAR